MSFDRATHKPLQLVASLSIIFCGVALPLSNNTRANIAIGSVLTTAGGVLLADSLSLRGKRMRAEGAIAPQRTGNTLHTGGNKLGADERSPRPEPVTTADNTGKNEAIVNCPDCSARQKIQLSVGAGSSAVLICENCGQRFHAHRNGKGVPFTRSWGAHSTDSSAAAEPPKLAEPSTHECDTACPQCNHPIHLRFGENAIAERYCLNCGEFIVANRQGEIVSSVHKPLIEAAPPEENDGRNRLRCPEHGDNARNFMKINNRRFAICQSGQHLIYAEMTVDELRSE